MGRIALEKPGKRQRPVVGFLPAGTMIHPTQSAFIRDATT
jgi:hypothetical protein